ncbi:primosome, DnaD subunit [Alkaliphilus metalliredigens QYMF]|uniref:Primosome, DnaD subunit n=1 Tax=Alkaliphilus metalliredigens (strain QYMF) TaxID=293826 RepID=A6TXB1_ALKMQ|nr:DnaD domain protein [Alkaliphilus metalliredigens]ABR50829.1 primosome, DnaD subunit [Alkaliphilus metalliredigens QYMF]
MSFIKRSSSIDLGDTSIENIFIDVYMPMANGTYVKVYLLGYKCACEGDISLESSNMTIAKHLTLPLSDVLSAWDFWESKGIIKKHPMEEGDDTNYTVEFINLKQLYIDNNFKSIQQPSSQASEPKPFSCSPKDLVDANKVPEIKEMFMEINRIIDRPLVPNEKKEILEWFYTFNIDPPLIIKAYSYCKHKKNIKSVKYVGGVARNWYDLGITTVEQLQTYLLKKGEKFAIYDRIFKAMGFIGREPSEAEIEIMNKWVDEYQFDLTVILKACANSSKTSNPNINYINGILADWFKKGIRNVSDIEQLDQQKKVTPSPAKSKASPPATKTKFHLTESRGSKYNAKELEELVLNRNKINQ